MAAGLRMSTSVWGDLALDDLFGDSFLLAVFFVGLELLDFVVDFIDWVGFEENTRA